MNKKKIKILMTASEVYPFAKVGGLADVLGSLPLALKKLNCDVRIVMPKYGIIDEKKYKLKKILKNIEILSNNKKVKINIWETFLSKNKVKVYFVDYPKFFGKEKVYYGNSSERFLFLSLAILHILPKLKFKPDIIHCHDFHTALLLDLIKVSKLYSDYYQKTGTLYTIHNLNYQGKSEIEVLSTGNLNKHSLKSLNIDSKDGDINFMVQGIINADKVNTVSKKYAKEICTSVYGAQLERIIKINKTKISGILNGIDTDFFNPAKDKFIKKRYSLKNIKNKEENKIYLQKKLSLPVDRKIPLIAFISRLVWQKGLELIDEAEIEKLFSSDLMCQFVFLGTGYSKYETKLKRLARKYPDKISAQIKFNIKLAQEIYAGADIFLMPSRFEPCGLGQMIAMRYGVVPVVRATGGLDDTVNSKIGFKFKNFEAKEFFKEIRKALTIYYSNPKKWTQLKKNCMRADFSWDKSAKEYLKLYKNILKNK